MFRIFLVLGVLSAVMIALAGSSIYWLTASWVGDVRKNAAETAATSIAATVSEQMNLLQQTLATMAADPEVASAIAAKDPATLQRVTAKLEHYFPKVLKIRMLLPGLAASDEQAVPKMGFADQDMVKETFKGEALPALQGDLGPDRHLALTAKVVAEGQTIGVILASLQQDFIGSALRSMPLQDEYVELKQGSLVIQSAGTRSDMQTKAPLQIKIPHTGWELEYWYKAGAGYADRILSIVLIVLPLLIVLLAFFVGHRKLSAMISADLSIITKAFKDMMTGKLHGNYAVEMIEMHAVISTLLQYKRVLDSSEEESPIKSEVDLKLEGFYEDSLHLNDPLLPGKALADMVVEEETKKKTVILASTPLPVKPVTAKPIVAADDSAVIFKAYDIRGIAGRTLTTEIIYDIGRALGAEARMQGVETMVVGRDGRLSSPELAKALANGVAAVGCHVLDIGMVPTPVLYFVAAHIGGRSGAMITGSHNPRDYNGVKMVINGETLAGERIQQLRQGIIKKRYAEAALPGQIEHNDGVVDEYIGSIADDIRINRPMVVVMDCGNGVTGNVGPILLKALGCEVIELNCDIDGHFPHHHPDPAKPENMAELIDAVRHFKADIGIAFDGDGDRLGVVDSSGNIIWPDRQMILFAKDVLAAKPGAEIIYDVKCSRHLPEQIAKFGGRPLMWKTGHALMKAKVKQTGAKLAGEMSGHIFFNDRWFGFDDALYAAARLIEILAQDKRSSADVFAQYPDSINTPELTVEMAEGENFKFMQRLLAEADFSSGKITDIDGLRVDFAQGWGLVRASNTVPALTLRFEADSADQLAAIQNHFRKEMKKIKPDIRLPF